MARPREFDEDEVLEKALAVFWAKGFEGATVDDLEQATGLGRGSLYGAFGGKHELFLRALAVTGSMGLANVPWRSRGPDGPGSSPSSARPAAKRWPTATAVAAWSPMRRRACSRGHPGGGSCSPPSRPPGARVRGGRPRGPGPRRDRGRARPGPGGPLPHCLPAGDAGPGQGPARCGVARGRRRRGR